MSDQNSEKQEQKIKLKQKLKKQIKLHRLKEQEEKERYLKLAPTIRRDIEQDKGEKP